MGLDIKNYSPGANSIYKQVSGKESVKEEQGKVVGIGEDLYSASVSGINPTLGFGTRIVYDDKGKPQLVPSRWGEPNEEPLARKVTPTAPSYLDSDLDTDSDVGDGLLLLEDNGIVGVSGSPSLVVNINQFVAMADLGQAQAPADGGGQPSDPQASEVSSKDGWLAPMKFS